MKQKTANPASDSSDSDGAASNPDQTTADEAQTVILQAASNMAQEAAQKAVEIFCKGCRTAGGLAALLTLIVMQCDPIHIPGVYRDCPVVGS